MNVRRIKATSEPCAENRGIVARVQMMMGDGFSEDEDEKIPDGEALQTWLTNAFKGGKDMEFAKYVDLSEAQKKEFLELAEILVACSTKVRNEGLLSIDEDLAALKTDTKCRLFLKKMLTFVIEGVDPPIVRQIGENYLIHDTADSFERFSLDMVLTGVLSIQFGDNPWILMEKIASYTGIFESGKFIEKLLQKKDEYEKNHPVSSQNENILHADFNAGEEGGTISQDEIDALLGGTSAENSQN